MQMHENPKPKVIAFHEGLVREHCVSWRLDLTRMCAARPSGSQISVLSLIYSD